MCVISDSAAHQILIVTMGLFAIIVCYFTGATISVAAGILSCPHNVHHKCEFSDFLTVAGLQFLLGIAVCLGIILIGLGIKYLVDKINAVPNNVDLVGECEEMETVIETECDDL